MIYLPIYSQSNTRLFALNISPAFIQNTTTEVLTQYEDFIVTSTALRILHRPFQGIAPIRVNDVHRRFVLYDMETLKKTPEIPGPKFVLFISSRLILPLCSTRWKPH